MTRPRLYLAGPEVFLPDAVEIGRKKRALCEAHGFEGLFPFDNEVPQGGPPEAVAGAIFDGNLGMMRAADAIVANLTPFRGPSADPGTVFELGFMAGLGRLVFGYSNDARGFAERSGGGTHDAEGLAIESFGLFENLMIDRCLAERGVPLVRRDVAGLDRYRDLAGFEACLRLAAAALLR